MQRLLALCVWQADSQKARPIEYPLKLLAETTQQPAPVLESVASSAAEPIENDVDTARKQITGIETLKGMRTK